MVGLILASVEGALDPASRARLEAHAASCAGCRRALDEQAAVKRMLADLPPVDVSRGFAARVRERVEQRPWWMPAGNWRLWTLRLAPIAAVLTILAWLPLRSDVTGSITGVTGVTGSVTTGEVTTAAPVGVLESWATAAVVAGANAAGESAVVPQLLDPTVHAHTILAPSASATQGTSAGGSSR
jgi:predicted anti-sigma-YlaC factor YlaD